jgi:hypothetical protein
MSDSTKRAERRENEIKHWERRLEREFNNNGRKYVDQGEKFNIKNCKTAVIPNDLKNSKGGKMLKHTNYLDKKDPWKDADIKNYYKHDRFVAKREIDNSIMEYNENSKMDKNKTFCYLKEQLLMCNDEIFTIEQMLNDLPERLEGLKIMKKEIEEEICWIQYGNN